MTKTVQVGAFEVRALTVGEGLDLLPMVSSDPAKFQKELLLRAVRKGGAPIGDGDFAEVVPHLADLIKAAMVLNGFQGEGEEPV